MRDHQRRQLRAAHGATTLPALEFRWKRMRRPAISRPARSAFAIAGSASARCAARAAPHDATSAPRFAALFYTSGSTGLPKA
jgi:acyl-coenzyme A synthetase/AMP-(fatty) acid ligase